MNKLHIFVAHAFQPYDDIYDVQEFRDAIQQLIKEAENKISDEESGASFEVVTEMLEPSEKLPRQIRKQLERCDFGIVDISDNNPNVFYELGFLKSSNTPCVILKSKKSVRQFPIPADILDEHIIWYESPKSFPEVLYSEVVKGLKAILREPPKAFKRALYGLWFPPDVKYIHIISSSEPNPTPFADRRSLNYMYLDNFGDKDAVLEVRVLLAKLYPKARTKIFAADQFDYSFIYDNLVVVGGPGDEEEGNQITSDMMMRIKSKVSYTEDCETLLYNGKEYHATISNGLLVKDYGYFARFPNPYNMDSQVILLHGIHTYGVLGAARAFSDHPVAQKNIQKIIDLVGGDLGELAFETFFPVEVFPTGEVAVPKIEVAQVSFLP